jgi:hypothetical protein
MGNILTIVSILISIISLMYSFSKDRELRRKEQADVIRKAAGKTIAKLDRWKEITLSLYQDIQPLLVETTEKLQQDFNVIAVRDYLWKKLNEKQIEILNNILKEDIETAYVDLYGFHPSVRNLFEETLSQLKSDQEAIFKKLLDETQDSILSFSGKEDTYQTAELGNRLRFSADAIREEAKRTIKERLDPLDIFLNRLVSMSDRDLLEGKER